MNETLTQEELKGLVSVTAEKLRIKYPAIVEKDYYVTQVVNALAETENEYFKLVFAGGTCLAKAHKIVKRMSEDIDFKIQLKNKNIFSSKNRLSKELKNFRSLIKSATLLPYLKTDDFRARNEGKYLVAELTYPPLFNTIDVLRPHLLLEFTYADIRLDTENLNIKTIIEDNIEISSISSSTPIHCISINETAIEKWIGLTRKISAIERTRIDDNDETLIRHVYDLNAIKIANKIGKEFFALAKTIIKQDAEQFKNQHPEYFVDPKAEIQNSLEILRKSETWKQRYQKFINTIVYDSTAANNYEDAILSLEKISEEVITILNY